MTNDQQQFNTEVTALADWLILIPAHPAVLLCAFLEATCKIAIKNDKGQEAVNKMHHVADYLQKEIFNAIT